MDRLKVLMHDIEANPYLLGTATAIFLYVVFFFLKRLLEYYTIRLSRKTHNNYDDMLVYPLSRTSHLFMLVSAAYVGFQFFPEYKTYPTWSWRIFYCTLMLQIGIWGSLSIKRWFSHSFSRRKKRDPASASSLSIVELMVQGAFLTIMLMFTLNNMGIKITTMLAGLGVGGIAIALALQNILGDLFSSLSIILDKPFVVGDFIVMGEWLGEVEYIGLKTTRIRSLSGEQIIVSNSDLLSSRIRNMKRMSERRNVLNFALAHETDAASLKRAVEIVTAVARSQECIRFDRCHFARISLQSLDLELVYFILNDDYLLHMNIQQNILLNVHQVFSAEGIKFAQHVQKLQPSSPIPVTFETPRPPSSQSLT